MSYAYRVRKKNRQRRGKLTGPVSFLNALVNQYGDYWRPNTAQPVPLCH
jgi:hypothetical protein